MAEPQETTTSQSNRARGDAQTGAPSEPRSFEQTKTGQHGQQASASQTIAQAAQPMVEGGRQLAEQGRRASRQMADVWRQAVDPLTAMQYDISQWFDDVFRQTFGFHHSPTALRPFGAVSAASLFGLPPAELKETEKAHILAIELPGLTRQDVDISIDGDSLVVSGQKAEENQDVSATYRVAERRYGRFERALPLPPDVDRTKIEAQFRDGLLKITLPKSSAAAQRKARIEIKG
jgi:HSP20 family protein